MPTQKHKPSDSAQALANYESLFALTGRMREAAVSGEWDQLISIERLRSDLVAEMKPVDAVAKLDKAANQRKDHLISEVLANDVEVRHHIKMWMGQLQATMHSNRQEQLLLKTYRV